MATKSVYLLMYVPFGCPAGDVDVKGVYESKRDANKALRQLVVEDEYDEEEVYIVTHKLIQKSV